MTPPHFSAAVYSITGNAGNGVTTASPATYSPYVNVYWNNFTNSAVGGVITNLVTTNNVATTIGVTNTASWSGVNGPVNGGLWSGNGVSPSASLLGDFALETATEDYFFVNTAIIPQFKVVGLASTNTYRLSFFGSRTDSVAARYTTNSVVSGNVTNIVIMKTSGPGIGSNGTYSGNDSNIVSTAWIAPDSNNQLTDTITYSGSGGHMNILAIMVNQPPVANNDTFSRDVGSPITINTSSLLANDTDPDGDALVFVSFSSLPAGVTTNATSITLPGTNTTQTFNYSITDGNGLTNTAAVTVLMKPTQLGIQSMATTALASNLFVVQPVIKILDALGNLVSTSAVVTVTASSGTVQGPTSVTASGGLATFSGLALTNSGLVTLTFSSPGLTSTNVIVYVYPNTGLTHQKILIHLGNNSSYRGTNVSNPDVNGHYWNSVWSGAYYANVNDLANNSTPIGFGFDTAGGADYYNGPSGAVQDPNACVIDPVALGTLGIKQAVYNYYTSSSFELNGLNSSQNFSLTFFGSHKYNTDNVTEYAVYTDNGYTNLVASTNLTVGINGNHNSNTVATITGLAPQKNSSLYVKYFGTTTASSGYLNCMQISVNHPPVANNDTFLRAAGTPITISKASLLANDSDPDGDVPLFVNYSSTNGAVTSDAGNIYLPANNSAETFTYSITDGNGLTNTATVTVNIIGAITNVIEVYGSSVAQGWNAGGSFTNGSYANGYAGLLTSYLGANGWYVTNNSTPGYDTSNGLVSFPTNVVPVAPNYVMLAFGLNNEGLAGSPNPAGTVSTFLTNLTNLISQCRSNGFYPVLGSCYPDTNYTASEYGCLKSANLTINSWNVPSYNLLGALDDGSGHYIANFNFDSIHPNTAGHQEFYYSFVPTLFNAIASGKTNSPYLASVTNFARLTQNAAVTAPITFTPTNSVHSFTLSFRVRSTNNGTIASIGTGTGFATLQITNGQIVYFSTNGQQIVATSISATNGDWHDVALSFRYALTNTWLFVDGMQIGSLAEQYVPTQFNLGGPGASGAPATPATVDFQNWCVYRSAWNLGEAQAQMQGSRQQASMEICAALDDVSFTSNSPAINRAQSLSVAMVNSANITALSSVTPPSNLAALSLSGTAAKLTWTKNSTTESGFELERRVTGTTNWSDVVLLPAGSISYTNSGLTAGVSYDYRVAAVEGGLRGNYSGIATVVPGIGVHQTILVDFGPNDGSNGVVTASPDYLGQYWNNFVGAGGGGGLSAISLTNLITTGAVSTSIGLNSSASGWGANGILNGGLQTPSYALLGNFAVTNATEDYFTTTTAGSFIITNLDSTLNYRLRLFGTRDTTITRVTRFIATGGNGSFTNDLTTSGTGIGNGGGNGNNSNIASLSGITPDGSKQIQLGVNALTGGFGYLGIMEIAANHPPIAAVMTVTRTAGLALIISLSNIATNWSDVDGDAVALTGVTMQSTNGVNLAALNWATNLDGSIVTTNAYAYLGYTNSPNVADQISYTIADGFGGTNTGYINIVINNSVTGTNSIVGITTGSTNVVKAYGIPGFNYILERATNLAPAVWIDISTNSAGTNGVINGTDAFTDLGGTPPSAAYYRLKWQP